MTKCMFFRQLFSLMLILFSSTTITTMASEKTPSNMTFEYGEDEQNGSSRLLDVNLALKTGGQFLFGFGEDNQKTSTGQIDSGFIYLGIGSNPRKPLSVKALIEYSGKEDQLTVLSGSLPITSKDENTTITFTPVYRLIDIYTLGNKKINVTSPAYGLTGTVYIGNYARLMGSAFYYDYSRNVGALTNFIIYRNFSQPTLLQASSLLDRKYLIETGMDYETFGWSVGWSNSISAVDKMESEYVYATMDVFLSEVWSVSATYGEYLDTPEQEDNFTAIALTYAF